MADIGSTLRETRIRGKIDITTVEQATKIRAKYLRALENEEWVVLPGPGTPRSGGGEAGLGLPRQQPLDAEGEGRHARGRRPQGALHVIILPGDGRKRWGRPQDQRKAAEHARKEPSLGLSDQADGYD